VDCKFGRKPLGPHRGLDALQNDKLLPVRLEKVKPPMEFRQTQTFDLIGWTGELEDPRLQHLIADLCAFAKIEPRKGAVAPSARMAVPTLVPAPASGEWLAAPTVSRAPDFTTHRAPTYRSIPGVAVPTFAPRTAEPDHPAGSSARSDELRPTTVALDTDAAASRATSPAAIDRVEKDGAVRSGGSPSDSSRSKLWWGLSLAATVIAAVWIVRVVVVPGGERTSQVFKPEIVTDIPNPNAVAAPADPTPPSSPVIETSPTDKPKARAADPPRTTPSRCIEIAEKFQTTGQLTAEERKYLSSKECAK
jgi:hypothetical protein